MQARDAPVASWEHALQDGEDPGELDEREFYGSFAQGGVCLADPGVAERVADHMAEDFERYELAFCGHGSALEEPAEADAALRSAARAFPRDTEAFVRALGYGPGDPVPDRADLARTAAHVRALPPPPGRPPAPPVQGVLHRELLGVVHPYQHTDPAFTLRLPGGGTMFVVRPGLVSSAPLRIGRDACGAPVRFVVDGRLFGYSAGEARL
ncbi:hypothetical protein [Nocardiopsis flavescens]